MISEMCDYMMNRVLVYFVLLMMIAGPVGQSLAGEAVIRVDYSKTLGPVNAYIFGNNMLGYDPATYHDPTERWAWNYTGFSDYGAGIWDPATERPVPEVVALAQEAGISIARFPGGCGAHHYNWKDAIGKGRVRFRYGVDEFLTSCRAMGADPVFTVSYFHGTEQDAADLVEYLNAPADGPNINGGTNWAVKRAENGHPKPYGVKYFEIGNEVWHGNHRGIAKVVPEEYALRYLKYYQAMKQVDSSISVGAVLHKLDWNKPVMDIQNWNTRVLTVIRNNIDFGIMHMYPQPEATQEDVARMDPREVFAVTLGPSLVIAEYALQDTSRLLKRLTGKSVPLAITEYNGWFVQDKPVPYRHTLGNALINAELMRIFMKPEVPVLMANHWQFGRAYTGMINFKGDWKAPKKKYYKRPNFHVASLYAEHFGDILLDVAVTSPSYAAGDTHPLKSFIRLVRCGKATAGSILPPQWKVTDRAGIQVVQKQKQLVIDFKNPQKVNYFHSHMKVPVKPDTYYRLSGYIRTENLVDAHGVGLQIMDGRGWAQTRSAASTKTVKGTSDWQYMETLYKTLPDAASVTVYARRDSSARPLRGRAYFKDVTLQPFKPCVDTGIDYLSVNASKRSDDKAVVLMVVNKHMDDPISARIDISGLGPVGKARARVLNAARVDSTNEIWDKVVKVVDKPVALGNGDAVRYTFEPHSLTVLELGGQ